MLAVSIFIVISINMSESNSLITLDEYTGTATRSLSQASVQSSAASINEPRSTALPQIVTTSSATTTSYSFPMDINKADLNVLTQAEGIGSKLAQKIIDYRISVGEIADMDSLMEIDGIGEAKLCSLKKLFYAPHDGKSTSSAVTTVVTKSQTTVQPTSLPTTTVTPSESTEATVVTTVPTQTSLTEQPVRRTVSINLADASELEKALLITYEQAEEIVQLRERIGGYSNILEILYCESISDGLYIEIRDYLTL